MAFSFSRFHFFVFICEQSKSPNHLDLVQRRAVGEQYVVLLFDLLLLSNHDFFFFFLFFYKFLSFTFCGLTSAEFHSANVFPANFKFTFFFLWVAVASGVLNALPLSCRNILGFIAVATWNSLARSASGNQQMKKCSSHRAYAFDLRTL